jgi:hypothetical protein
VNSRALLLIVNNKRVKLKIKYVKGKDHDDERIVISVLEDTNMRNYIMLDSTFKQDHKISNKDRHPYCFPTKAVSAGDLVVL